MNTNQIEFKLARPEQWYQELSKKLPAVVQNNKLVFNAEFGSGGQEFLEVQPGLWGQKLTFTLLHDLELCRMPNAKNDFFQIDFYLSNADITSVINNKTITRNFETVNMALTSSMLASKIHIPANKAVNVFNVLISKEWLFNNVIPDYENLREFFSYNTPIYLSENLDYRLKDLVKRIDFGHSNKITSMSIIIQIVDYLFLKFGGRELFKNKTGIHTRDFEQLAKIREQLDANPQQEILLTDLASGAGMSLSKFKRLFKQVFGTTPYKYHLQNKMEKAMETLKQGEYSVSETGFLLGYSNLSQFSKAFKNQFGVLPRDVKPIHTID
ncbi:MAG: helix-turn-helix domain-containing protein [Flavobacteriaceae bacterium]